MNWKKEYNDKLKTAEEAVKYIKSGNRVVLQHAVGEPMYLVEKMVENYREYQDVEIIQLVAMGKSEFVKPEMKGHFKLNSLFLGRTTREAENIGDADFTPSFFYQVPSLFDKILPVDVALISISTPDEYGYCSLGVSCDYTKYAVEKAKIVIAQVNKFIPRTLGLAFIHISEIDILVEKDEEIKELELPKIGNIEKLIGEYCASLIKDGDTLQLGIGAIPDAVLLFLNNKKDLGIHSEMISDGVVDLVNLGVITNRKKNLNRGKSIVSFLMGTKKLYNYVNNNPEVELHPVDYVNNPLIIAQNDNMVSINSAIQIDLMGQVNSESIKGKQFSGTGGQVDFVRGATMSKGGRSIIALPSTTAKGKISKIVLSLDEGSVVTTSRNDVDYVITEYGIAHLKGKTLRERAKALIKIAHPDFREELTYQALKKYKKL